MNKKFSPDETVDIMYSHEFDAYYDVKTGEWTEEKCEHDDCEFCSKRPDKACTG